VIYTVAFSDSLLHCLPWYDGYLCVIVIIELLYECVQLAPNVRLVSETIAHEFHMLYK